VYDEFGIDGDTDSGPSSLTPSSVFMTGDEVEIAGTPTASGLGVPGAVTPPIRMVSTTGEKNFIVFHRPAGGNINCTGVLVDRLVLSLESGSLTTFDPQYSIVRTSY
jgi:hypothetical protein